MGVPTTVLEIAAIPQIISPGPIAVPTAFLVPHFLHVMFVPHVQIAFFYHLANDSKILEDRLHL